MTSRSATQNWVSGKCARGGELRGVGHDPAWGNRLRGRDGAGGRGRAGLGDLGEKSHCARWSWEGLDTRWGGVHS